MPVVDDLEQEIAIVQKREAELRSDYQVGKEPPEQIARMLVTLFQEMRAGATKDGKTKVKAPASVLSTAEAISVLFGAGILSQSFGEGPVNAADVSRALVGAIAKEGPGDLKAFKEYCETVAKTRSGPWKDLYAAQKKQMSI